MNTRWIRRSLSSLVLFSLASLAPAQEVPKPPTAASLIEQGQYAEEHEHDFAQAAALYESALKLATDAKDAALQARAKSLRDKVASRAAGVKPASSQGEEDALTCRIADLMQQVYDNIQGTQHIENAYRDLALLGTLAVPWLEKAIQGRYTLCDFSIEGDPPIYIRALAMMSAPEATAVLDAQLSSRDPLVRRAVVENADPVRHRALLLRAIKDPAQAVRDQAVTQLSGSSDPANFETMASFARAGDESALDWLVGYRPEELLRVAAAPGVPPDVSSRAITHLKDAKRFRPDAQAVDALLGLSRAPREAFVRNAAMQCLVYGVQQSWKPLPPELARRIEAALIAEPDAFPAAYVIPVLSTVGSAASLAPIIERSSPDEINQTQSAISRIVSRAGPEDFAAVVAAFAKTSVQLRGSGQSQGDPVHQSLRMWLAGIVAAELTSTEVADGAKQLPPAHRFVYLDVVVASWISERTNSEAAIARLSKLDPAFISLLRELTTSGNSNSRGTAIRGLGVCGDPSVLPDLMALVTSNDLDAAVADAIRRLTKNDPQRVRTVMQLMLANKTLASEQFGQACASAVGQVHPDELLASAQALWSKANAARLCNLVSNHVPGANGCQFLLAHYAELEPAAARERERAINRFGDDLHEPALELIGQALLDPNPRVRNQANAVFQRFKEAQQQVAEFKKWREGSDEKMVAELMPLLSNMNAEIVLGAVKALTHLRARECMPKLIPLLERFKDDPAIKAAVMQAIDQLAQ